MNPKARKSIIIFIATSVVLAAIFFLFPINLFDGVIVEKIGETTYEHERPLSLSYFIGMGYDEADMINILDYYLKPKGIIMAVIFIFGLPGLLAYRIFLRTPENK